MDRRQTIQQTSSPHNNNDNGASLVLRFRRFAQYDGTPGCGAVCGTGCNISTEFGVPRRDMEAAAKTRYRSGLINWDIPPHIIYQVTAVVSISNLFNGGSGMCQRMVDKA
jgi:hypothetical protein